MECRIGCAACCIEPSISSPLPQMPLGKPAGVRCLNLSKDNQCTVWGTPEYPPVCQGFKPELFVCGTSNADAFRLIATLEKLTAPNH